MLLFLLTAGTLLPQNTVTVETLKQFLQAFNRHDLDAVMSFFDDDCRLDMPRGPEAWGQRYIGKAEVRRALATNSGSGDLRLRFANSGCEAMLVVVDRKVSARHLGSERCAANPARPWNGFERLSSHESFDAHGA